MRRIENPASDFRGVVTYEYQDPKLGRRYIDVDARALKELGLEKVMQYAGLGHLVPTERVPVVQHGRVVGSLPGSFDPVTCRSTSLLYDPRPGDFVRDGDNWVASRTLGPGDLDSVQGFQRGHRFSV